MMDFLAFLIGEGEEEEGKPFDLRIVTSQKQTHGRGVCDAIDWKIGFVTIFDGRHLLHYTESTIACMSSSSPELPPAAACRRVSMSKR